MKDETSKATLAQNTFLSGFNCAQSSLFPFLSDIGISTDHALKLTTAFGAGMIYRGETCGAITGAMMAIGLKHGRCEVEDLNSKELTYALVSELHRKFEAKHGSIVCRELLKLKDLSPESWGEAGDEGKFKTLCPIFVSDAVSIAEKLMNKTKL